MMVDANENIAEELNSDSNIRKRRHESIGINDTTSTPRNYNTEHDDLPSKVASQLHRAPQPIVSVYVGNVLQRVPQSTLLSHVWGNGFDSKCMACGKPFQSGGAPPIRTVGFEIAKTSPVIPADITQTLVAPYHIRIINRHFTCIKARKVKYVPVSHAWHEDVAIAQNNMIEDIEVSRIVYQTVVRSLLAVTKKYGESEIWHDYMSVPQWRHEVQQQILLAIPTIYNYPERTVIHLHDVQAVHLHDVHTVTLSDIQDASPYKKFVNGLSAITSSQWFERMWVTLEYMQSNETIILAEDFSLCTTNAREISLSMDAVVTECVRSRGNDKFTLDVRKKQGRWPTMVSWSDMETWKSREDKHRTLGFAIGILCRRKCREQRDYYLALGAMLDFKPKQNPLILIQDTFQYFLCLALHALETGDYTPLLFTPLKVENVDPRAPWLHGYSKMSGKFWDLGVCHRKAKSQQIIRNDKIMPELESVGIIEWFEYYNFAGAPDSVFGHVASKITRAAGTCPKAFCSAVDRIFTRLERKALYTEWETKGHQKPMDSEDEYDLAKLGQLLNDYVTLQNRAESQESALRKLDLLKQMIIFLNLDKKGKHTADSRLAITSAEAEWYREEYGKYMEGIGQVSCKFCGRRSIFRFKLWEKPTPEASQVYRIPGLLYDETVPEGVGLVICGQKIIGKMTYGTPACECHRLEIVDLGTTKPLLL